MPGESTQHRGEPGTPTPADHDVRIVDTPTARVHHPADLLGVVMSMVGIILLLVLAVYAHATTSGFNEDVQDVAGVVRRILFVPVAALEGVAAFIGPVAVLVEMVSRKLVRQALEAFTAALLGVLVALLTAWLITQLGVTELRSSFWVWSTEAHKWVVTVPALLTGSAALLTAAGRRSSRRSVAWSWNFVWIALGVATVVGAVTLPGALVTVLVGRACGLATRYAFGVQSERAYGRSLVAGIRRAGFAPVRLVRVRDLSESPTDEDDAPAWTATADPATVAIARYGDNRVYAMTTADGDRLDVIALDGDRQVVGVLTRFWRSMRLRGIEGRAVVSLRQAAERTALLSYAAWSAGVCTPRLLGMAEADDSMLLIQQHAHGAVPLRDVPEAELTDDVLDTIWQQLSIAHGAGLAHRGLTADVILVGPEGSVCPPDSPAPVARERHGRVVLITGWDQGDVASSELARRMDVSHLLAVLALKIGADRAVASAVRKAPGNLATIGPLLQPLALPRATREEARGQHDLLGELRESLLAHLPKAVVEPERIVRFGARTVVVIVAVTVAVSVVIGSLNFANIREALADASPWWVIVAFGLGLLTYLGSAVTVVAFSPVRLSLWRVTLVQAAASYVALGAPAGIGPAAMNLRMLNKRGVSNALAVASVGLVQLAQFVTTVLLLGVLMLASGSDLPLGLPSSTQLIAMALVALAAAATLIIPSVRQWTLAKLLPVWQTTWPRLVQLIGQPKRFTVAVLGSLIMTLGYLGAFWACISAFGRGDELSLVDLAIIYLFGNAAGAIIPTPSGLGGVEAALVAGLNSGDIKLGIATPIVLLFRFLTFWIRIPIGWVATKYLQRRGDL
jgi:uncharacterized membrane protein YbhN (UPF0104 family)